MQKTNKVFKRIFLYLIVVIMCLSPVLLSGCVTTGGTGGTGGDSGGTGGETGETGGGTGETGGSENNIEPTDYLSNYKITYRPNDDELSAFMLDIKQQTNEVAFDIMRSLYAEYGAALNTTSITNAGNLTVKKITIDSDGNYVEEDVSVKSDKFLKETKPLFSSDVTIIDPESGSALFSYEKDSDYSKYFTHANAIYVDYNLDESQLSPWNWSGGLTSETATLASGFNAFVNNLAYRKKLELAILLICNGYDITPTGSNYSAYTQGAELIDNLRTQFSDNIEFYKAVDKYVLDKYTKLIDHSGYTKNEISHISNFILDEIIGTSLVAIDNTRYLNVYVKNVDLGNLLRLNQNPQNKNFLGEESFATKYYTGENFDIGTRNFYNGKEEYAELNKLMDCIEQFFIFQSQEFEQNGSREITNQTSLYIDGVEVIYQGVKNQIFNNFIDTGSNDIVNAEAWDLDGNRNKTDGKYTADFWDLDNDGDTTKVLMKNDMYQNLDYFYSIRKQFFKNYTNTAYKIVKQITKAIADEEYLANYQSLYSETYEFEIKYPIIPASFTADYLNDEILLDSELGRVNITTGYRRYQNMVIMPKEDIFLDEFLMFMTRQPDSTGATSDFDVSIYIRYYDATSNSFAVWESGDGKSQFYDCGTYKVNAVTELYEIDEPVFVDLKTILSNAQINGTKKGNSLLTGFSNLPEGNSKNPTLLTRQNVNSLCYGIVDLPNNARSIAYNISGLPAEERTSYVEIFFSTGNNNFFQFSILPTEFSAK